MKGGVRVRVCVYIHTHRLGGCSNWTYLLCLSVTKPNLGIVLCLFCRGSARRSVGLTPFFLLLHEVWGVFVHLTVNESNEAWFPTPTTERTSFLRFPFPDTTQNLWEALPLPRPSPRRPAVLKSAGTSALLSETQTPALAGREVSCTRCGGARTRAEPAPFPPPVGCRFVLGPV